MESEASFLLFCHLLYNHNSIVDEHRSRYICGIISWPFVLSSFNTVFHRSDFTLGIFSVFEFYLLWTLMQLGELTEHTFHLFSSMNEWVDTECSHLNLKLKRFTFELTLTLNADVHPNAQPTLWASLENARQIWHGKVDFMSFSSLLSSCFWWQRLH